MALMALPKFILMKSTNNNKYLRYRKEKDEKHAILEFCQDENEENVEIQYAKFEVQNSKTVEGFVHIRSCYNKYWVKKSEDSKWIAAEANEPEEDASKWSCTLFKSVVIDDEDDALKAAAAEVSIEAGVEVDDLPQIAKPQKIRLVHSDKLGERACVMSNTDLVIGGDSRASLEGNTFIAYDATWLVVLPERVSFLGGNERYGVRNPSGYWFTPLQFSGTGIQDPGVVNIPTHLLLTQPQQLRFQNTSLLTTPIGGGGRFLPNRKLLLWGCCTPVSRPPHFGLSSPSDSRATNSSSATPSLLTLPIFRM